MGSERQENNSYVHSEQKGGSDNATKWDPTRRYHSNCLDNAPNQADRCYGHQGGESPTFAHHAERNQDNKYSVKNRGNIESEVEERTESWAARAGDRKNHIESRNYDNPSDDSPDRIETDPRNLQDLTILLINSWIKVILVDRACYLNTGGLVLR